MRIALLVTAALAAGCNMVAFTANQTSKVLEVASPALNQESDPELARLAAPASLKTVEGFHLASPGNETLITILARGYCEYSFGFLEFDVQKANARGDDATATEIGQRATGLFLRCMNYGLKLLGGGWEKALYADQATFDKQVSGAGKGDVPGMFFTALGLAQAINLNRDDIEMVAFLPKALAMFERVAQLDGNFYNGGAHMALGMLYSARGEAVGGDPERGKKAFDAAIAVTGGKFLMPRVLMAQAYATITNNRELFHSTLVQVLETSPAVFPDQRLANELAHRRARFLLEREKEIF
jgi:hypothetical protein